MKKGCILTVAFLAIVFSLSITSLLLPDKDFSEEENRYLQQLPDMNVKAVTAGKYTAAFEKYTEDQFPLRTSWIGMKTATQKMVLKKDNGRVYFGKEGQLFSAQPIAEKDYMQPVDSILAFVDRIQQHSPDLHSAMMLVPTASEVLKQQLPLFAPVPNQSEIIQSVQNTVEKHNMIYVNPLPLLTQYAKREQVYYRTDHHWTTQGAYLGYLAWADTMNQKPLNQQNFTIETVSRNFFGTLYSKSILPFTKPDTIHRYLPKTPVQYMVQKEYDKTISTELYDKSFLEKKDQYAYFLGGNHPQLTISTSVKNDKQLLLFKDSYANAMIPFLANHYEKLIVVDLRYFKGNLDALWEQNDITDMMFLYNVETFCEESSFQKLQTHG